MSRALDVLRFLQQDPTWVAPPLIPQWNRTPTQGKGIALPRTSEENLAEASCRQLEPVLPLETRLTSPSRPQDTASCCCLEPLLLLTWDSPVGVVASGGY